MPKKHKQKQQQAETPEDVRRQLSFNVRQSAATLAASRALEPHLANSDERHNRRRFFLASFTKGLPHDPDTGLLHNPEHYHLFINAANTGLMSDITALPLGPAFAARRLFTSGISRTPAAGLRAWDNMAAGLSFDLQGPDAQAVSMPPAPALRSSEMAAEMTELYWMCLLRDVPFSRFPSSRLVRRAAHSLNKQRWVRCDKGEAKRRQRGPFNWNNVFRGVTRGDDIGPYISQFLLMGTPGVAGDIDPADGFVQYGAVRVDQRVRTAARLDYMTTWGAWLDVQNGADVRGRGSFAVGEGGAGYRFITTPRDLATYVHFDASYQPYHTACLILLDMGVQFDAGLPFQGPDALDKQAGFVSFGGPHVLSLVAEVATRALKAVCYQKFNVHRRLRPEAVGGLLERYRHNPDGDFWGSAMHRLYCGVDPDVLRRVEALNQHYNTTVKDRGWPRHMDFDPDGDSGRGTLLLPMAYPEGSPMHPSYGAGHATVAGACVTILKAFFDASAQLPATYVPTEDGETLMNVAFHEDEEAFGDGPQMRDGMEEGEEEEVTRLTVEGELNKLCSNMSIGRNWAGVHYFSDYYESIVMGEKIALSLLQEQKITLTEEFSMTVPLFDGSYAEI